jgi:DNA topoisomerase IA
VKNECFSINIIDDYSIGSVDTILYFLYTEYISNRIYNNDNEKSQETLYYINQFEDYINAKLKNNVEKRLNSVCYGKINDESIIREMWKKKMTLKYIS